MMRRLTDGWKNQIIFPLNVNALKSPEFVDLKSDFFGGQQANKEVYVPAANGYKGMTYTPFGQYYYTAFTKQIAAINEWVRDRIPSRGQAAGGRRGVREGARVHGQVT